MGASVGVDVGGTFTDLVAVVDGELVTAKVPSVRGAEARGIAAVLRTSGIGEVDVLAHGTTVATNALLERRGARTALVTTEGFRDVIEIGRQARASLFDLAAHQPAPLVPRELRFTVRERMGPDGVIVPLDEGSLAAAVEAVRGAGAEAVAVCLLFSYLHPEHERRVGEALRAALPTTPVSLSVDVLPEFREYERCSTTVANAYLAPALSAYLAEIEPQPLVMQSSGGVVEATTAAERPAACVLSGPAAGVAGAAFVAGLARAPDVLTFDMGGTSTDVAAVLGGSAQVTAESVVGGVPIRFPMVDFHTIGAGGGSIAWLDDGGALRVGPRSAGASPGPACYGLGGEEPTVTDANLVLGHLRDGAVLGGEIRLDRGLAVDALARLAVDGSSHNRSNPGLRDWVGNVTSSDMAEAVVSIAEGIVRVVNANMARALRVVSVERGIDPRGLALVAFGGAGPLHACSLAEELGIERVLVPRASGVLSALGLAVADLRRDYLGWEAEVDLPGATVTRFVDARYPGQSHELTIEEGADFHAAHERRYGFRLDGEPEVVTRRLVATVSRPRPELPAGAGEPVEGPAIVELPGSTCLVRAGWAGKADAYGTLELTWTR
jgi:N-methylhydantoinase A